MIKFFGVYVLFCFLMSCSNGKIQIGSSVSKSNPHDDSQKVIASSNIASFTSEKAQLKEIKELYANSRFQETTKRLLVLYDQSSKVDIKEECLYLLALVDSNSRNPLKDYDRALDRLDELMTKFPETKFKTDVILKKRTILKLKEQN